MSKLTEAPAHVFLTVLELSKLFKEAEEDEFKDHVTTFEGYSSRAEASRYIDEERAAYGHTERFILGE